MHKAAQVWRVSLAHMLWEGVKGLRGYLGDILSAMFFVGVEGKAQGSSWAGGPGRLGRIDMKIVMGRAGLSILKT